MCRFLGQVLVCACTIVGMVRFKFLAHCPVDHLAHPVVSSLVLHLCQFAVFYYFPDV